ncbi:polyphosphate kinase [Hespellia stercorisuis DSM 15480]|uniref:Polyphosphate kinase n=2 Tax=Hespellia stercorisuis TaxID=180311 RepID=A0A1M6M6P5_9FIRM|nr:polyphosphate kinase 1 [Hespellia stercorisuis]SHJ79084.1 polyphosphate kinase [Hespellia stercorisuis DSM 15480]
MAWNRILQWIIDRLKHMIKREEGSTEMAKKGNKKKSGEKKGLARQPHMMNRELSWLKFNERVLNEAGNPRVPLAERLTFASIYQSNLDEFYMVRVGTLMDQMESSEIIRDNKTNMTSAEQVKAIVKATGELDLKKGRIYEQLMGELEPKGIRLINFHRLSDEEGKLLETYFDQEIAPYLSPSIISKQQPFPFLRNKEIYAVALLATKGGKTKTAIIPCSNTVFKRLIEIPTRPGTFMLSEEIILHFLPKLFKNFSIREKSLLRVTRNADIDTETIYDEDLDYRDAMENLIKQRKRMNPVRMELSRKLNKKLIDALCKDIHVNKEHVFLCNVPLDMSFVFTIQNYLKSKNQEELFFRKRSPRMTPELSEKGSLIEQVTKKDVLLSYPFENIKSFTNLLYEAAKDESVVSIKMTLYRLADKSQVVDAMVEAAENGKDVTVLVELRARFDEESNIEYSRKLEEAGCHVIYGLSNYKVHSKLCLITRKTENGIAYITQVGTGNYNEKTSTLYTDLSLITANMEIGKEAAEVFACLLRGEFIEETNILLVAPKCLQNKVLDMIDEEIAHAKNGEDSYVGIKINSLTDKVIIDKLIEASQAGVKIEMVVRGICCLIPGVEGYTENIKVVSIVGRFLEHSRIYRFGTKEREKVYIASADFMTRNTVRRVEVAAPILDEKLRDRLDAMFKTMLRDDEKGKLLNAKGDYEDQKFSDVKLDSQETFYQMAYEAAEEKKAAEAAAAPVVVKEGAQE